MLNVEGEIKATDREVGHGRVAAGEGRTVSLRRTYDAPIEDVWDAVTNPERITRWFLPVTGDLRLGGTYQLKGNAGGEIMRCEPPRLLAVTWVYGENPSESDVTEVEVRLSAAGSERTLFELAHTAVVDVERWTEYGPGAVGVGWDGALLGLGLHLAGGQIDDPSAWQVSPEARRFYTLSSEAWGEALRATGVSDAEVAKVVANVTAFYAPEPDQPAG